MNKRDRPRFRDSSSDRVPHKPTRERATSSQDAEELKSQRIQPSGSENPERLGVSRQDVGGAEESGKHRPHVTSNDHDAPIQDELPASDEVPVLPANAAGSDSSSTAEQDEPVDDESMYERRPGRDKDQPPSKRDDE